MIKGNHKSRNIDKAKVPHVGATIKSLTPLDIINNYYYSFKIFPRF